MSAATYTPEMGERIAALLSEWKLPTAASELVRRLVAGRHVDALTIVVEVLELEAAARKERRVERLRRASKLPPGKTFETLDKARVPRTALLKVQELSRGDFVEQANNVLFFGLPGVGKSHLACALGHAQPWSHPRGSDQKTRRQRQLHTALGHPRGNDGRFAAPRRASRGGKAASDAEARPTQRFSAGLAAPGDR